MERCLYLHGRTDKTFINAKCREASAASRLFFCPLSAKHFYAERVKRSNPFGLKKFRFIPIFFLFSLPAFAQLVTDNSASPEILVQEVLLGEGVAASQISFNNGPPGAVKTQIGSFSGGLPHIGLESGLILATGRIEVAEGPNNVPTAHLVVPENERLNAEPDLEILTGGSALRDVAKLEFDFVAKGDTVRFRYVFASEEYNDHTCSPYNDAFGFFVSGPGITGNPNFANSAKNTALVPGTQVPVAINTVNSGQAGIYGADAVCLQAFSGWQANSIYFVNNAGNPDPGTTQFDGFTVPMLIEIPVICGETYHIKMAVADAVDDKNDSAVFIEAESFSGEVVLEAALEAVNSDSIASAPFTGTSGAALENCGAYSLSLYRSDSAEAKTISLRATNLADAETLLSAMPTEINFAPGEGTKQVVFGVAGNQLHEGLREWTLELLHPHACGQDTAVFSLEALLDDRPNLTADYPDTLFIPCHSSQSLQITPSGGYPPYSVSWNQGGFTGFELELEPDSSFVLSAAVTDRCNSAQAGVEIVTESEIFEETDLLLPESIPYDCENPITVIPEISGGTGEYTFRWMQGGALLSEDSVFHQTVENPGVLTLEVNDRCAAAVSAQTEIVWSALPISVYAGEGGAVSCKEELIFIPEISGGFGGYTYLWHVNGVPESTDAVLSVTAEQSLGITLTVTDRCDQQAADTVVVINTDPRLAVHLPADTAICEGDRLELRPAVTGNVGDPSYLWTETGGTSTHYVSYPRENRVFHVKVTDECGRTAEASVAVEVSKIHADFEFDYDYPENPLINLSTDDCAYLWSFPDGTESRAFAPRYFPEKGVTDPVMLTVSDVHGCEDAAMRFYDPPMTLFIPNAFTPDGDGKNDVFKAVGRHVVDFHMWIFDKGGNPIFETTDIDIGWDGSGARYQRMAADDNIFPYRYVARTWSGQIREGHGSVTLLR